MTEDASIWKTLPAGLPGAAMVAGSFYVPPGWIADTLFWVGMLLLIVALFLFLDWLAYEATVHLQYARNALAITPELRLMQAREQVARWVATLDATGRQVLLANPELLQKDYDLLSDVPTVMGVPYDVWAELIDGTIRVRVGVDKYYLKPLSSFGSSDGVRYRQAQVVTNALVARGYAAEAHKADDRWGGGPYSTQWTSRAAWVRVWQWLHESDQEPLPDER